MNDWPKEEIPDEDRLFRRAHRGYCPDGELGPGIIRGLQMGMSADWNKYSTPEETRQRAPKPDDNGVVQMIVGELRKVPRVRVEHAPDLETRNRAHAEVYGPDEKRDQEVRLKLLRLCEWVVRIRAPQG